LGGANTDAAGYLKALVSSAYSRDAETAADRYAIERMQKAGIAPADTAGFFARLASDEKKLGAGSAALGYLSSHPLSKDREKMFRDSALKGAAHTPALTPQQWRAVVEACANDPDVEGDGGLFF
jgi:predicted Zn-dependent protease